MCELVFKNDGVLNIIISYFYFIFLYKILCINVYFVIKYIYIYIKFICYITLYMSLYILLYNLYSYNIIICIYVSTWIMQNISHKGQKKMENNTF